MLALDRQNQFPPHSVWPKGGLSAIDDFLEHQILGKHRGLLVLDDVDVYMVSRSGGPWKDLIASYRHYNLDLVLSARAPQNIDVTLLGCLSRVCIFRTTSPHARKHYERLLSEFDNAVAKIPKDPFVYLECDFSTRNATTRKTVPM